MKKIMIALSLFFILFLCSGWLLFFWTNDRLQKVEAPVHVSLRTDLYDVLREDTLILNDMKIKRIYYVVK